VPAPVRIGLAGYGLGGRYYHAPHPAGRNPAGPIRPAVLRSPYRHATGRGRNHTDVTSLLP
jgi:hypothetical protein